MKISIVPPLNTDHVFCARFAGELCSVSAYENVSWGRNRPAAHKGYPGNAVPIATRPEMERASISSQGTRVTILGYQEGERALGRIKVNGFTPGVFA